MKCLEGITDKMDMNLGKLQGMVRDREAWHAAIYGAQRVGHNWAAKQQTYCTSVTYMTLSINYTSVK